MSAREIQDLGELNFSNFLKTVNQSYTCVDKFAEKEGCELTLTEVVELVKPDDPRVKRTPFVLVFKAPTNFPVQQAVYQLVNNDVGHLAVFLVPVASSEDQITLEATFT